MAAIASSGNAASETETVDAEVVPEAGREKSTQLYLQNYSYSDYSLYSIAYILLSIHYLRDQDRVI